MSRHLRGVYVVKDELGVPVYVGSTTKHTIEGLEENHRDWFSKGYGETWFRKNLSFKGNNWTFSWAIEPSICSQEMIEIKESALIQYLKPQYNIDMDPYESSIKYNRYRRVV